MSYKRYTYKNNEIIVYAGVYHHYIKINKEIFDEHDTIISYSPIKLSCLLNDGTDIVATISLTNRITLKINNKLYKCGDE